MEIFELERSIVSERSDSCTHLLQQTESTLRILNSLKNNYKSITPRTSQLHNECKTILEEKDQLNECYEKIKQSLSKYEELRSIIKRLPDIKLQILNLLNNVYHTYQKSQNLPDQDQQPLDEYYGRFYVECRRVKDLMFQLESCLANSTTTELLLHLEEIYMVYFEIREQLMSRIFSKNLDIIISRAGRNHCDLLRITCNSLVRIIRNEIQLFGQLFPNSTQIDNQSQLTMEESDNHLKPLTSTHNIVSNNSFKDQESKKSPLHSGLELKQQAMKRFLELLCRVFYEHLRSVVIHINHLETLAEMHKMLTGTIRNELTEDYYESTMNLLAGDIQERMTFRVEVFIQENILDYKPSSGDLAYPEKLEIVSSGHLKDYQAMWYPTVQRTVMALFYMNRVFDKLTFSDLAHELITACLKSLDVAQKLINERHHGTQIEADLFLTKHLEIIKGQLVAYCIDDATSLFQVIFPNLKVKF